MLNTEYSTNPGEYFFFFKYKAGLYRHSPTNSYLSGSTPHHDVEDLPLEPGPTGECVGVKLRGQTSLELRLQDVAAKAVWQKSSLV